MNETDKFRMIFDGMESIIYISDPNTYEILYVNKITQELFPGEVIGKKCYKVFQNLEEPCSFCTNDIIFGKNGEESQSPYIWEFHNKKVDRWFHITDQVINWEDGPVRFEMAENITDKKIAEIEIEKSKKNLTNILSNLKDSVFVISEEKKILYKNEVAHDYFGEDLIGKQCYKVIRYRNEPCEDCPFIALQDRKLCQYRFEKEIEFPDKRKQYFDTVATYLDSYQGEKVIIELMRDITNTKLAHLKVKESEKKYRNLIEGLNEVIYKMDLRTGEYEYMGPAAEKVFGFPASNFLDNPSFIQKIIHPDFIPYFQEKWQELMENKVDSSYEYKIIDSAGSDRWIRQSNIGINDDEQNLIAIEGICRDVTINIEAEKELEKQAEWLRITLESIGDGVIATDTNAKVVFINPIAEQLTGWASDGVMGRDVHEIFNIINETTREKIENPVDKIITEGKIVGLANHTILISKNGEERNIADSGAPIKNSEGEIIGVVLVFRDITRQYQMQKKIAKSEEKYRELFESITDGIGMTDLEGNIIDCNQEFTNISGYTLEELKSIKFQDITPKKWHKFEGEILENQVLKRGFSDEYEKEYIRKNGEIIPVSLKTWVIQDEVGNAQGLWAIVRDISERKHTEEEILDKTKILSAINKIFSITLKGVSEEEVAKECLEVVQNLTENKFGFIGEFNENGLFDTIAMSDPGWDKCRVEKSNAVKMIKNMEIRGLWSIPRFDNSIHIINSPKNHPKSVGIPEGHPELLSLITAPLNSQNKVKGILCLGNKEDGYTEKEKKYLEALTSPIIEVILRTRAENAIIRLNEELEYTINERIKELSGLYDISKYVENEKWGVKETLQKILNRIKPSFQYPRITEVRIKYKGLDLKTEKYRKTKWQLHKDIYLNTEKVGGISVVYLEEKPEESIGPFFQEEDDLLEGITDIISRYIEKLHARKLLKASERKFRAIFEHAAVGIAQVALDGKFLDINKRFSEITGYLIEELNQKDFQGITHPKDLEADLNNVNKLINGEMDTYDMEKRYIHKNGEIIWVNLTVSLVRDNNGEPNYFISIIEDITERKETEKRLEKTLSALRKSNSELQQFAYIASHDLQEPMRTVGSFTQIIRDKFKNDLEKTEEKYFNYIIDGTKRMKNLINDLLSFSRVTSQGKEFSVVDVGKVLKLVLRNLQGSIEDSNAHVTYDKMPTIKADSSQIFQVFQNLISNSIKFHGEKIPVIHVSVEDYEGKWQFSVNDNGIGIDPEYFDRIFIIFQRLNQKRDYKGTGIGLAICKKIVERHEGKIWVESEEGQGSTFYFTIPKELVNREEIK